MTTVNVRRNRARTFKAALETLKEATSELIAHLDHDMQPYDETQDDLFENEHGSFEDTIEAFDDALEYLPQERDGYLIVSEAENRNSLTVSFKEGGLDK